MMTLYPFLNFQDEFILHHSFCMKYHHNTGVQGYWANDP